MFAIFSNIHPSQDYIKWDHYCQFFNNDSKNMLKICPKISRHHMELNNLTKIKRIYGSRNTVLPSTRV
ncbi:Transposable element P transposase [Aphis craccivora]|uniref:Transposable element P transposase n=1 Tax=Aphis craccivora TaxID=307492 RepID=A0A6G0VZM6_APHCR|nr:Transposable element P transposase [Aphis craccivora]